MKEIPNYPGYYVTETGGFYSTRRSKVPRLMKQKICKRWGYCKIGLMYKTLQAHRIVAQTFIPNPNNLPEVNHKDENKLNNNVENLEWVSRQRNAEHSQARHYIVENVSTGKKIEIYNLAAWCRDNGIKRGKMYNVVNGKKKTHKGWTAYHKTT